jgi:hypothetical protein
MNDELEGSWEKATVAQLWHFPQETEENHKKIQSQ